MLNPGVFRRFPEFSSRFDASRPSGSRIVDLKVNGRPLDEARKYTLTAPTFVALDGGDGYTMLKDSTVILPPERAPLDSEALQRAISSVRAIAPKVEGRIKRLDTARKSDPDCK